MQYCIDYKDNSKYKDIAQEIKINFTYTILYPEFLKQHSHQRVIIDTSAEHNGINDKSIQIFTELRSKYNLTNFTVLLPMADINNEQLMQTFKNAEVSFFFIEIVKSWTHLNALIKKGVSDIYVAENLCFAIDKVAALAHKAGIKIRTFPNVAQKDLADYDIYSFFIRPEDIHYYEKYIDVCEFFTETDKNNADIYYKIYAIDKKWFGDLQEIIIGLNQPLDSRYIIKQFAEARSKCEQKCFKGIPCNICEHVLDLMKTLKEKNLLIDNN